MRTERLQTLADAIFAIALMLLVLALPVPEGSSGSDGSTAAPVSR